MPLVSQTMNRESAADPGLLAQASDKFLYFFLGLRKGEIRRRVSTLRTRHPEESPEQLARRIIAAQAPLSVFGGMLLQVPMFVPTIGPALKVLGVAGATTVMMRMHMALILEIAILYGHDIDDVARLREMAAVVAATGLASSTPWLCRGLGLQSHTAIMTGGMTVSGISQLVGEAAIRYYGRRQSLPTAMPAAVNVSSLPVGKVSA